MGSELLNKCVRSLDNHEIKQLTLSSRHSDRFIVNGGHMVSFFDQRISHRPGPSGISHKNQDFWVWRHHSRHGMPSDSHRYQGKVKG